MFHVRPVILLLTTTLVPACTGLDPDQAQQELEYRTSSGGAGGGDDSDWANTNGDNGLKSSALNLLGLEYDGWRLLGVDVRSDGGQMLTLSEIDAEDGVLYGQDELGAQYSDQDFIGSIWRLEIDPNSFEPPLGGGASWVPWVMVIEEFIPQGPDSPQNRYVFTNGPTPEDVEAFKCDLDLETKEFSAIVYTDLDVDDDGTHFEVADTLYIGCISGSVGKAGMWGYPQHDVGLEVHQAATRMVRADYCGHGVSYTQTGTRLLYQDALGIKTFPENDPVYGPPGNTEAMWTASGALCLMETRRPEVGYENVLCNGAPLPMCEGTDMLEDWGAVLWTKASGAALP
ncbi:MAG: ADYC domain-containing protein [Myxococcota bacterium]